MNDYENLLEEAHKLGTTVIEIDLGTDKPCGKCVNNIIFINSKISIKDKYCILAEELGHYKLTVGNITDQSNVSNRKQELVARRWGNKKLVRLLDLIKCYKHGAKTRYEIAEFLGVTENFLQESIHYYRAKYGTCFVIDNYTIYFEPYLGIMEMF
ncbi:ImmA/IrrE family metallo-endopeptidase [Clostridium massiliodielmoense]|uniref:ImmA/IrrE family metallo-endopeptidase n=1 Tax=Clostridium massiliodielmoense TaxID=1776385 RepID=UPI000A27085A|nr:ImmA/IrrE family metallo-endopeptidase [Clostridium massiliodielmoense]